MLISYDIKSVECELEKTVLTMGRVSTLVIFLVTLFAVFGGSHVDGFGPGHQDWGFVDVREGSHMFYWLYYTTANVKDYTEKPLVIWLEGGPGLRTSGFGNFEQIGPLDLDLKPRNHTWVKNVNVLFIDSPVGSGFSYVDNDKYLATNNQMIAKDLVTFMKEFYKLHPEFKTVPIHIFGESYGGKMASEFTLEMSRAIKNAEIESNLKLVALGDPWVNPLMSVYAIPSVLLYSAIVDVNEYDELLKMAMMIGETIKTGNYSLATSNAVLMWNELSNYVDLYNIMAPIDKDNCLGPVLLQEKKLHDLMSGPVSRALGIPWNVDWGSQKQNVFLALFDDFMKPVVDVVEKLLTTTDTEVIVYGGQLDLIVATVATETWVYSMKWPMSKEFAKAPRSTVTVNGVLEGFVKKGGNLSMYWVNRAGHAVAADNPAAMDYILQQVTKHNSTMN